MINEVTLSKSPLAIRIYVYALRVLFSLLQRLSPKLASRLALQVFLTPPRTRASRWERKFEQQGTYDVVRVGDKQLRLLHHGTGSQRALLVHGWGSRGTHLGSYGEALVAAGYGVYSLDGPAHGESTGSSTDMMEFAQAIAVAAQSIGGVDLVVGHSFGAACTLLAIDRCALKAKRLVLISCFADAVFITEAFARFFGISHAVIREMRMRLERRYRNEWDWASLAPKRLIRKYDNPILLIHDLYDDEVPFEHAQELRANHANAQLFSTRNQGHRKILRDRTGIDAAIAFLNASATLPAYPEPIRKI
ncbi:alpha/beta hydrolase family protein [Paraburkholderia rhizosphaerae]|uniref:Alpha/beta hydrolase family protein n=1 Tax=Paraburkholderia rhizosphaerae TaxID=480658 RepID=A0A4R8LTD9_9BURK|nr:alpha/beta fold hydrolase [Paraburkholderia rhizosphaerae]TDY50854.1 alpha/beta hydrolase family protein [Paraburkholderia rhizosphaerae]